MKLKRLPRDEADRFKSSFKGKSGKKYRILSPEDGIGITRYSLLVKMSSGLGFGVGLVDQKKNWAKVAQMLNDYFRGKEELGNIFTLVKAQYESIGEQGEDRYNLALYIASIFIIGPDEDIAVWNKNLANEKIEDWSEYHEQDFFTCALEGLTKFLKE